MASSGETLIDSSPVLYLRSKRPRTQNGIKNIRNRRKSGASWPVVDMHCHVLPGIDDGARDMSETLAMLQAAQREGITAIIATPHFRSGKHASSSRIIEMVDTVQAAADKQGIDVQLYPGNEVYWSEHSLPSLREGIAHTLNETNHVLVEFSPVALFNTVQNALSSLMNCGYTPVVAHIERYECLMQNQANVELLASMGALLQVNASSITGGNGRQAKRFTASALKEGLVDFIGTDAHGATHRPIEVTECRELVIRKYGESYARTIFHDNARALVENRS